MSNTAKLREILRLPQRHILSATATDCMMHNCESQENTCDSYIPLQTNSCEVSQRCDVWSDSTESEKILNKTFEEESTKSGGTIGADPDSDSDFKLGSQLSPAGMTDFKRSRARDWRMLIQRRLWPWQRNGGELLLIPVALRFPFENCNGFDEILSRSKGGRKRAICCSCRVPAHAHSSTRARDVSKLLRFCHMYEYDTVK